MSKFEKITPTELKRRVIACNHESHFFDRETMRYFGDTMANFGVSREPVRIKTREGEVLLAWELYRKKPVECGLQSSNYFDVTTYKRVFPD